MIMEVLDNIIAKMDIYQVEKAAMNHAITRHETRIENHEQRIKKLEKVQS